MGRTCFSTSIIECKSYTRYFKASGGFNIPIPMYKSFTIWAGIYGCLNSVEKLRPVSPLRGDGCASRFATEERTNIP